MNAHLLPCLLLRVSFTGPHIPQVTRTGHCDKQAKQCPVALNQAKTSTSISRDTVQCV